MEKDIYSQGERGGSIITLIYNFWDSNQTQLDRHFTVSGTRKETVAMLTYIPRDVVFIWILVQHLPKKTLFNYFFLKFSTQTLFP